MTLTLANIVAAESALNKIVTVNLPARVAYRINKLIKQIAPDLKTFNEERTKLFQKFGKSSDSDPNMMVIMEEHMSEFTAEFNALISEPVELSMVQIRLSDLTEVNLTPLEMSSLEPFILDDDDPVVKSAAVVN